MSGRKRRTEAIRQGRADDYTHFTWQARRGITGEAFVESLLCQSALTHHVVGPKDIGIDFICEWVHADRPTGVLFAVQVKAFDATAFPPTYRGTDRRGNGLARYDIKSETLRPRPRTRGYWAGLGIPVYLFAVGVPAAATARPLACYYKRYTPSLTTGTREPHYREFFRANAGHNFFAFGRPGYPRTGFARDLFIDHVRCSYAKGSIIYPDPVGMGLTFWKRRGMFIDLFPEYAEQLCRTYAESKESLERLCAVAATARGHREEESKGQ